MKNCSVVVTLQSLCTKTNIISGKLWCTCRRYGCNIDEWRYSTTCSLPIFPWQWDTCCKWFPWWLTINYGSSFGRFGGGSGFGLSGGFSGGVGSGGSGRVGPVGSVGFGGLGGGGPIGGVGVGGVGGVGPVGGVGVGGAGGVGPVGGVGIGGAGGLRGYGKGAY